MKEAFHTLFYALLKHVLVGPFVHALCRFEVEGDANLPSRSDYVVASNHIGGFDPIVMQVRLPGQIAYVAKIELFRLPILGRVMVWADQIALDREKAKLKQTSEVMRVIKQSKDRLDRGIAVGLFPEGTRSRDGKLHSFSAGAAAIAIVNRRPLVPVGIAYSWSWRRLGLKVRIVIGEPIETEDCTSRDKNKLTQDLRQKIAALSGQMLAGADVSTEVF